MGFMSHILGMDIRERGCVLVAFCREACVFDVPVTDTHLGHLVKVVVPSLHYKTKLFSFVIRMYFVGRYLETV